MKRISAVLAALLISALAASAGGVRVGVGFGLGGIGFGFRTHGFGVYGGFPGYYYPGYYAGYYPYGYYGYYGSAYAPYYADYPAYSYYNPAVTYTPSSVAPAVTAPSTATTQAPVIINNYNYYNTSPQAGVNAMFGR